MAGVKMTKGQVSKLVKWPKIFLLGDSQTQFGHSEESSWISTIANYFQRKCDVLNRGFSGYNTRWVKLMLPKLIDEDLASECAAVTIFMGSNDSNLQYAGEDQHVPLEEYKATLIYIGQHLMELGVSREKMVFITPPPVDEVLWSHSRSQKGLHAEHGMRNDVVKIYADACCKAAKELGADCIDLYSTMMEQEDWKQFVDGDGLHLAPEGGLLLTDLLLPKLQMIMENYPELFPDWKEIDKANPAVSLE